MGRKKRRTRKTNGAGSITKLSGFRSKPWMVRGPAEIQIDGSTKRKVIGYYKTSEDAEMALAKYKINRFNLDEKDTTLGELFEIFLENKKKEVKTKRSWEKYEKAFHTHLFHLKDKPIRSINYAELQDVLLGTVEGTSKHLKQALVGVYDIGIKSNILNSNIGSLLKVSKIKAYTRNINIFDKETIHKIIEFSNTSNNLRMKKMADMTLILLYSGMRAGELRTIEKENIFLNENYMIGGIKTEAGKNRIIPIHPFIKNLIVKYIDEYPSKKYLFSQERSNRCFSDVTFVNNFLEFRKLLNFEYNRHATRHTFISEMKRLGISADKIKKIVGHSTSDITDGVYTHYEPEDLIKEVIKIRY